MVAANEYPKGRARMLAQLGYVAFVADMYGDGKTTNDAEEGSWRRASIRSGNNGQASRRRIASVKESGKADNSRLGAIGYCMGGSVALTSVKHRGGPERGSSGFYCGLAEHGERGKAFASQGHGLQRR